MLGLWPTAPVTVIILAFRLYAFFSGGGHRWWLLTSSFPPRCATAVSIAISFSRIGTIAATCGRLASMGRGAVMLIAAGLVLLRLVLSYFLAPEARGKSLAETSSIDDR